MDKKFCQQIDQESLVEHYVAGKLRGQVLTKFEQHIVECEDHARAVLLEKALKRGVSEFARGEIKTRLHDRLKKREDTRFLILRYAAILLVAVIAPLILYYQFNVAPHEMSELVTGGEQSQLSEEADITDEEEELKKEQRDEPQKTELKARRSVIPAPVEEPVKPAAPAAGAAYNKPKEDLDIKDDEKNLNLSKESVKDLDKTKSMVNAVKIASTPKLEADYPQEPESQTNKTRTGLSTYQTFNKDDQSPALKEEINTRAAEDSLVIRECIDKYLQDSDREDYRLELKITVGKNGNVNDIIIIKTSHPSSDLQNCLLNIIKSWTVSKDVGAGTVSENIIYRQN